MVLFSVDGGWSEFGDWSGCDRPCGVGERRRHRTCTNPKPEFGGNDCNGTEIDTETCENGPCQGESHNLMVCF